MLNGRKITALIPARGGSKTIPLKNLKTLSGKPLLAWPIESAQAVSEIDEILVSTDHPEIAKVARQYGAEVVERPSALATDTALVVDVVRDLAQHRKIEILILLEATSPLRQTQDIQKCLQLVTSGQYDSVGTFTEAELNPHRAWRIKDQTPEVFIPGAIPWLPRQKLPAAYRLNGAVYALDVQKLSLNSPSLLFGKIGAVIMPKERSVDIDDALDFAYVEALLKR